MTYYFILARSGPVQSHFSLKPRKEQLYKVSPHRHKAAIYSTLEQARLDKATPCSPQPPAPQPKTDIANWDLGVSRVYLNRVSRIFSHKFLFAYLSSGQVLRYSLTAKLTRILRLLKFRIEFLLWL